MALGALVVTVLLGVPLGIIAGTRPQSLRDRGVTVFSAAAISAPDFWVAIMLVVVLAVQRQLLPSRGYVPFTTSPIGWYKHLVMPWLAMGIPGAAAFSRQLRGSLIDSMEQDYVRTAHAKGLSSRRVIFKHALKNAVGRAGHGARAPIRVHARRHGGARAHLQPSGTRPVLLPGAEREGSPGGPGSNPRRRRHVHRDQPLRRRAVRYLNPKVAVRMSAETDGDVETPRACVLRRFRNNRAAMAGLVIFTFMVAVALVSLFWTPQDP